MKELEQINSIAETIDQVLNYNYQLTRKDA